jgi:hypothetical protein
MRLCDETGKDFVFRVAASCNVQPRYSFYATSLFVLRPAPASRRRLRTVRYGINVDQRLNFEATVSKIQLCSEMGQNLHSIPGEFESCLLVIVAGR